MESEALDQVRWKFHIFLGFRFPRLRPMLNYILVRMVRSIALALTVESVFLTNFKLCGFLGS